MTLTPEIKWIAYGMPAKAKICLSYIFARIFHSRRGVVSALLACWEANFASCAFFLSANQL
jgi:hypothetical protein